MDNAFKQYRIWQAQELPQDLSDELEAIENNQTEIYNRFCKDITFGTSGLRGKMGAGSNRINSVVLKRASRGVSSYLHSKYSHPRIAVSYDTRINSKEYAKIVADEFSKCGVNVFLFHEPTPVPVLSFAVRRLGIHGGIMITASHNPKEFNGYKVYDDEGNQIGDSVARIIERCIEKIHPFEEQESSVPRGTIEILDESIRLAYVQAVLKNALWWDKPTKCLAAVKSLKTVYTPLNGSGLKYVLAVMEALGFNKPMTVSSQLQWDGQFKTCPTPNPENPEAFNEAIKQFKDSKADIIFATDPDSDRMGVMCLHEGKYCKLSGNEVGEILLEYICRFKRYNPGTVPVAFKSLVSSPLTEVICKTYGVEMRNVFTGFKNIAFEMGRLEKSGRKEEFVFGFEESYGYLYGNYTRDKDGIMASQLICLAAAYCKSKDITLVDFLREIYLKYGYQSSKTYSRYFENEEDRTIMDSIMKRLFDGEFSMIEGKPIGHDYSMKGHKVYRGTLPGGHIFIIRPSGTELKLKAYVFARGSCEEDSEKKATEIMKEIKSFIAQSI